MRKEMNLLAEQLKATWDGEPWFGRNGNSLLGEVDEKTAFVKLKDQHSILQLVCHMANWKAFAINRLRASAPEDLHHFEAQDWQDLDHTKTALWPEGLQKLKEAQATLLTILQQSDDSVIEQNVRERDYNNRQLINGIIQHDIYHLGQIAFIVKQLQNRE